MAASLQGPVVPFDLAIVVLVLMFVVCLSNTIIAIVGYSVLNIYLL